METNMAYNRKPVYHFETKDETGIHNVPAGRIIIVEDWDSEVKIFKKDVDFGTNSLSTVEDAFNSRVISTVSGISEELRLELDDLRNQIEVLNTEVQALSE
jgi:hypothetical protein